VRIVNEEAVPEKAVPEKAVRPNIDAANREAVARMIASRPRLVDVATAGEVIPGLSRNLLLHAGPPIEWPRMSGPLRGAIIGALIFEGLAKNADQAAALAASGDICFAPCHHHRTVGPMAGVVSSSMAVWVVEDETHGGRFFSTLNEGYGKVLRYGAYDDEVLDRLRFLNDTMAPMLAAALAEGETLDLRALLAEALHMGDEGHNRNKAGSILLTTRLAPHLAAVAEDSQALSRVLTFLGENALSVLNPVMAAAKAMADAAHGVAGSTVVSAMARNGTDFGIRVSGLGERWFTAPCATPEGLYFAGFTAEDANPDIGDSTITETAGFGAFAMASAPAIVRFVSGSPRDAIAATLEMYEITVGEHEHFTIPPLDFRGTPVGIDVRRVVELGITPRVNTGIAHKDAGVGQIGAGLVRPPMVLFEQALEAFAEKHGFST
jgi:hypothetical protein